MCQSAWPAEEFPPAAAGRRTGLRCQRRRVKEKKEEDAEPGGSTLGGCCSPVEKGRGEGGGGEVWTGVERGEGQSGRRCVRAGGVNTKQRDGEKPSACEHANGRSGGGVTPS